MAPLSDGQVLATAICAGVGCFLSILGSSCIVYSIVSKRKYNRDPYHRLLLGMSLMDVIHSFWFAIGPVLVPKDSSQRAIALGSTATCSASGFFAQFGISVFLYSAMLSIYYVLTIRYSVTMSHMIRREKIMHCVAIFYPLLTAFSGLPLGLYNEIDIGLGCWINDFPDECTVNGRGACVRGYNAFLYGYFFSLIPAVMSFLVVLFSNVLIFLRARHVEHANRRFAAVPARQRAVARTNAIATQAFLYVLAFCNSLFWFAALRIFDSLDQGIRDNESSVFWLILLGSFLYTCQGIFSTLIMWAHIMCK
jgi:hypothetical protein